MKTTFAKTHAFTLVELLVVISIIAILAGLITVAAGMAIRSARDAAVRWNMEQIAQALEQYKNEYGEYPPDFTDPDAVIRHVKKRWPRYNPGQARAESGCNNMPVNSNDSLEQRLFDDIKLASRRFFNADPTAVAEWNFVPRDTTKHSDSGNIEAGNKARMAALAFWLGGFPATCGPGFANAANPTHPAGFSADATDPFFLSLGNGGGAADVTAAGRQTVLESAPRGKMYFTINEDNWVHEPISATNGVPVGMYLSFNKQPLVYYRGTSADNELARVKSFSIVSTTGSGNSTVYHYASKYTHVKVYLPSISDYQDFGIAVPYARSVKYDGSGSLYASTNSTIAKPQLAWYKPESFQLISPGRDSLFSKIDGGKVERILIDGTRDDPTAQNKPSPAIVSTAGDGLESLMLEDLDNIVNFSETPQLKGQIE